MGRVIHRLPWAFRSVLVVCGANVSCHRQHAGGSCSANLSVSNRTTLNRWLVVAIAGLTFWTPEQTEAQAGLRESLERLDRNQNGYIEPDEITPLARPYLERISGNSRASVSRPTPIADYQEAARAYHAIKNGVIGTRIEPKVESTVKPFGSDPGNALVPEFGLGEIEYPYTQEDLDHADRTISSYDRDDDNHLDVREASRARWTHRNPFDSDLNRDGKLSRLELAERYARRRLLASDATELIRKRIRTGGEVRRDVPNQDSDSSRYWYRSGGPEVRLTFSILERFDRNRDGKLTGEEIILVGIPQAELDGDLDGEVSRDELYQAMKAIHEELGEEPAGLPPWFYERDANKDGQVSLKEYATEWSTDQLTEFARFDMNQDGLLTTREVLRSSAAVGGQFRSETAEILSPRRTVISEIEVQEDVVIGKLKVELSITHSNVTDLDAYLTGPDGEVVELFTAVGGSGNHFERTKFDDESPVSIAKGKPPYIGTYRPEALDARKPGLSSFKGKNARGIWQLIVRGTRSERSGMLHYWSLDVEPVDAAPGEAVIGNTKPDDADNKGETNEPKPDAESDRESEPGPDDRRSRFGRQRIDVF